MTEPKAPDLFTCTRCRRRKPEDDYGPGELLRKDGKRYCRKCNDFLWAEFLEKSREQPRGGVTPRTEPERRKRRRHKLSQEPVLVETPSSVLEEPPPEAPVLEKAVAVPAGQPPEDEVQSRSPEPVQTKRYADVGHARGGAKAVAARENGRKGGRPPRWSKPTRLLAATWLRERLDELDDKSLEPDLHRLIQALEEGTIR